MRRLHIVSVSIVVLVACAVVGEAASAFTLPDLSLTLTGATYPAQAKGELPGAQTTLGSSSGATATGKGVQLSMSASELSALGTYTATYSAVETPSNKEKCKTGTEAAGTVVSVGEYHIVPLNTTGTVGTLFLVSFLEVACGTLKVKIRGDALSSLNAGSESQELTLFTGALLGENGNNKLSEYINDTGSKVKTSLESDAGLEFVKSDENVAEELATNSSGSQMVVITGR